MRIVALVIFICSVIGALGTIIYTNSAEMLTKVYSFFASMGYYFLLLWLLIGLPNLIVSKICKNEKLRILFLALNIDVIAMAMVVDLIVFSQYRFHVNAAMLDLFFHGGQTITFTGTMWLQLFGMVILLLLFGCGVIYWSYRIEKRVKSLKAFNYSMIGILLITQVIYMFAMASYKIEIIASKEYIPLFQPLQANKFIEKLGFAVNKNDIKVNSSGTRLNYPLKELVYSDNGVSHKNIIFLLTDSLRSDVLNAEVMPNTWNWAQDKCIFTNHFSCSNCTRTGIFGLFYSLPPSYWHPFFMTNTPPVFIKRLQELGYDIQAFASAPIDHPEFTETVFASVRPIRVSSKGNSNLECDEDCIKDLKSYLEKRDEMADKRPLMLFVFFDSPHGFNFDKKLKKFEPSPDEMNYIGLSNNTDRNEIMNLYKNSVYTTDNLFAITLNLLKKHNLADDSIIVVSSDHGQEINDSNKNFWGHNSAFNDAQTKTALVIQWPGKEHYIENRKTTSYDIVPTIMKHEFNLTSNIADFSVGMDLFTDKLEDRKWFITGGYNTQAIKEEDRIIEITSMGILKFLTEKYDNHPNQERTPNIYEALQLMSKYLR